MSNENALVVTMQDVKSLAQDAHSSHSFPIKNPEQAVIKIVAGRELGIPPIAALRGLDIIDGQIQLRSHLMAGIIKASIKYHIKILERTDDKCAIEFFERVKVIASPGNSKIELESVGVSTFTMEDAKRASLAGKDNWKKYPRRMLYARALSEGASTYCPDLFFGGIYGEGEIEVISSEQAVEIELDEDGRMSDADFQNHLHKTCTELRLDKYALARYIRNHIRPDGTIHGLARNEQEKITNHMHKTYDYIHEKIHQFIPGTYEDESEQQKLKNAIIHFYGPLDEISEQDYDKLMKFDADAIKDMIIAYEESVEEVPTA